MPRADDVAPPDAFTTAARERTLGDPLRLMRGGSLVQSMSDRNGAAFVTLAGDRAASAAAGP